MSKKVCHITSAHGRYDVRIFMKQCRSLAKNGYDVTLVVNDNNNDEVIDGVKIISTRFAPKNRAERFFNSKKLIFKKAFEIDADIYQIHDPELLPLGNKLKRMNKKLVFDSHEDVPRQIMDKNWIPGAARYFISKAYEIYEKESIKYYDGIISVTPHVVERLFNANSNTIMITNYPIVDPKEVIDRNPENAICFAGGIDSQWNHDKILAAIDRIESIKYVLAGSGSQEYMNYLRSLPGWKKVEYEGRIPHAEVKNVYSRSIAGVALNYSNQSKGEGTLGNTKLFEFMAAKLPVICSDYKLWKAIINENKCGICVDPNNVEEIVSAIKYLLENPEVARIMGENGRKAVIEKYNWTTQEKTLLELYNKLSRA